MSRTRYWGPFKQIYYSICSYHRDYSPTCRLCQYGDWTNVCQRKVGSFVYKRWPNLWRWWANHPLNKEPDFMRKVFPRMRRSNGPFWPWSRNK